jgi:23S rRNA pseudouridine1911/1915/1917 synthase
VALNAGYVHRERLGSEASGRTVLAWLCERHAHSDEPTWRGRLERGELRLDEALVGPESQLVPGRTLAWHRPPWDEPDVPLAYGVLFEDDALLAVHKPSGLPTMPAGGFYEHTLLRLVQRTFPEATVLHRLGRGTSGLVLFARTGPARATMHRAFREHALRKHYRALSCGVAATDEVEIVTPIGEVEHPLLGRLHAASPQGRTARSLARVVSRRARETLWDVEITTGRPHQIRIHLASIGHPLAGDPLYGPGGVPAPGVHALPGDLGYLLHAHRLTFAHPVTGRATTIVAPPPPELA